MKTLVLLLLAGIIAVGCASSDENNDNNEQQIENLVELRSPGEQRHTGSDVYIDSVRLINDNNQTALLVSGSFPDGCTHLGRASHTTLNGQIKLSLSAWRDPDMMCTQVLTPFSFIYSGLVQEKKLKQQSAVLVNGTPFELK